MCSANRDEAHATPALAESGTYLDLVADLTREYAVAEDLAAVHLQALERICTAMDATSAALFLVEGKDDEVVCHACIGGVDITGLRLPAGTGIVGRAIQTGQAQKVDDVGKDKDFNPTADTRSDFVTRSLLNAPMIIKGRALGAISVVNPQDPGRRFAQQDMELLQSLANAAAMAINNARMTHELLERERMRQELVLAAEVQRRLLPDLKSLPRNVFGISRPAREMSGDFFDVVVLPDQRVYFAVADVSGKGLNAALLMVKTTSLFRMLARSIPEPGRLLAALNRDLCESMTAGMFVTMTAGVYDPASGRLCLSNAGHMPTLLRSGGGRFRFLSAGMPPLGIACDTRQDRYPEDDLLLSRGELYLYTDGVTEGRTASGMELGVDGMCNTLDEMSALPLSERLEGLVSRVGGESHPLRDDVTLLGIETRERRQAGLPLYFRVNAIADRLAVIRDLLNHALGGLDCEDETRQSLLLAVDEACQNIIRHAYAGRGDGEIEGRTELDGEGRLVVRLADQAPVVPDSACAPRAKSGLDPGGLGNRFINDIMDEVYYDKSAQSEKSSTGNCLVMIKALRSGG